MDDDDRIRDLVKQYLEEKQFLITTAKDAVDAKKKLEIWHKILKNHADNVYVIGLVNATKQPILLANCIRKTFKFHVFHSYPYRKTEFVFLHFLNFSRFSSSFCEDYRALLTQTSVSE